MSRKHFIALAKTYRAIIEGYSVAATRDASQHSAYLAAVQVAKDTANVCAEFNPNFDRNRFLTACGIN